MAGTPRPVLHKRPTSSWKYLTMQHNNKRTEFRGCRHLVFNAMPLNVPYRARVVQEREESHLPARPRRLCTLWILHVPVVSPSAPSQTRSDQSHVTRTDGSTSRHIT